MLFEKVLKIHSLERAAGKKDQPGKGSEHAAWLQGLRWTLGSCRCGDISSREATKFHLFKVLLTPLQLPERRLEADGGWSLLPRTK